MKKGILLAGFFCLLGAVGLVEAGSKDYGARGKKSAQITYRQEGNRRIPFAVTCASETWTLVISSEPKSRQVIFFAPPANAYGVCLSSSAGAYTCADTTPGAEIQPGASMTDYGTYSWYCKSRNDDANEDVLKGFRSYHDHD